MACTYPDKRERYTDLLAAIWSSLVRMLRKCWFGFPVYASNVHANWERKETGTFLKNGMIINNSRNFFFFFSLFLFFPFWYKPKAWPTQKCIHRDYMRRQRCNITRPMTHPQHQTHWVSPRTDNNIRGQKLDKSSPHPVTLTTTAKP